jgi:hypothetical protein
MTAVPKPLKFLRPHYEKFEEAYQSWPAGDDKVRNRSLDGIANDGLLMEIDFIRRHALSAGHDIL